MTTLALAFITPTIGDKIRLDCFFDFFFLLKKKKNRFWCSFEDWIHGHCYLFMLAPSRLKSAFLDR